MHRQLLRTVVLASLFATNSPSATAVDLAQGFLVDTRVIYAHPPEASLSVGQILINRNGEVAFVDNRSVPGDTDDFVVFYTPGSGLHEIDLPGEARVIDFKFSNWGAVINETGTTPRNIVYTIPLEGSEQFQFQAYVDRVNINDEGVYAFASRPTTGVALRDIRRGTAGGPPTLLPDLNETRVSGGIIVDNNSRVIQAHTIPNSGQDIFRFSDSTGWTNLTDGRLTTDSFAELAVESSANVHGDFLFQSLPTSSVGVHYYDSRSDSVFDIYSTATDPSDRLRIAHVADNGRALFLINTGFNSPFQLYEPGLGVVPIGGFVPDGETLHGDPTMNSRGDVVFVTRRNSDLTFSGYLIDSKSLEIMPFGFRRLSTNSITNLRVDDELNGYFWIRDEEDNWFLRTTAVPEPSAGVACALAAVLYAAQRNWRRFVKG